MERPATKPTSPWLIALAWLVVTIPLGWGVYMSVHKSLPIFQAGQGPGKIP